MIIATHWDMRAYMREFRTDDKNPKLHRDARLPVLLALVLHANNRLRCWPSTKTLCHETGYGQAAVVEAREWLITRKALSLVPYDKREGEEKKLPQRQFVYQLTGSIVTSKGIKPYMVMTPETAAQSAEELADMPVEVSTVETLDDVDGVEVSTTEISRSEISTVETKGSTSKEGRTNSKGRKKTTAPVDGAGGEETNPPADVEPKPRTPYQQTQDYLVEHWFKGNASQYGRAGKLTHMLHGTSKDKGYADYNMVPPVYVAELARFRVDYLADKKAGFNLPESPAALNQAIFEYRERLAAETMRVITSAPAPQLALEEIMYGGR